MVELRPLARAATVALGLGAVTLFSACATAPAPEPELDLTMRQAEDERQHASPAARDALSEGLRWIVLDAPGTNDPPTGPATPVAAERGADSVSERPATPNAPATDAPSIHSEPRGEKEPASHLTSARLHLRAGPSLDEDILAILLPATEVVAKAAAGKWVRVETAWGRVGWVDGDRLEELAAAGGGEESATAASAPERITSKGVEQ